MITVDDRKMAWQQGMTLAQLLTELGESRHVAVVRLNGKLVSRPHFALTYVPDKAAINLIPIVAGG